MRVLAASDFSVWKCEDRLYTKFAFSSIIKRYSENLGTLSLCCPVKAADGQPEGFIDITDLVENVVPETRMTALRRKRNRPLEIAIDESDLVLGRFPGFIPLRVAALARKKKKPCFAEVMACGWDGYWNHGPLGKLVAPYMLFATRHALKKSDYALYVTEHFLQKRYPCGSGRRTAGVSNVVIPPVEEDIAARRTDKIRAMDRKNIVLMTCAAVNVWYKGQHFVIRAIPILNRMGIRVTYYCVGQGDPAYLKKTAEKCGVEDQVVFTGVVPHDTVFELLDQCDIYIQPSLQEGLPRAMVEAMSRGCPAAGARTGGIPELIPEECVVRRKSVEDIAETVARMLDRGLEGYAAQNLQRAEDFKEGVLDRRRNEYFRYVQESLGFGTGVGLRNPDRR